MGASARRRKHANRNNAPNLSPRLALTLPILLSEYARTSCTLPVQPTLMLVNIRSASQQACIRTEWICFLLTYSSPECGGFFVGMCVPSMAEKIGGMPPRPWLSCARGAKPPACTTRHKGGGCQEQFLSPCGHPQA